MTNPIASRKTTRRPMIAAFVLGVAMSGFFDGILLHQVLQWHHLLSLVPGRAIQDPRVQVMADGLFHVLMYGLAVCGLLMLWGSRGSQAAPGAGRAMAGAFVGGFGAWNVIDVGFFHWILRIHNIRLDVANPLTWDVGWLVLFGVSPLLAAIFILRGRGGTPLDPRSVAVTLTILTLAGGPWAMVPAPGAMSAVLFRPGLTSAERWTAVASTGARVVATDVSGDLMVVAFPRGAERWRLFADGAIVVGGAMGAGCLTVSGVQTRL